MSIVVGVASIPIIFVTCILLFFNTSIETHCWVFAWPIRFFCSSVILLYTCTGCAEKYGKNRVSGGLILSDWDIFIFTVIISYYNIPTEQCSRCTWRYYWKVVNFFFFFIFSLVTKHYYTHTRIVYIYRTIGREKQPFSPIVTVYMFCAWYFFKLFFCFVVQLQSAHLFLDIT